MSQWLLLLWFDFDDDVLGCIDLERQWVLCDDLNVACHLRLYGVRHMVKDHSDSERGYPFAATWATLFTLTVCMVLYHMPYDRK